MNYNLRVEMERSRGNIVTQIEVSGIGKAGRRVITSPDFDQALVDLKNAHSELLGSVEDYHQAPPPAADQKPVPKKKSSKKKPKA